VTPTPWFDSHCHLQERYLPEAEGAEAEGAEAAATERVHAALGAAATAGVTRLVCVGTDPGTSRQALALARHQVSSTPRVWATVGQHPHEAAAGVDAVAALVDEAVAARDGALVAVGECGLDYHYEHSPRPAQREAFAAQIALARRHGLALVIHARSAWDDLFDVLAAEGVPERTVLHCFTGGPDEARRCLTAGMCLSFSGIVTFKNADEVRQAAALCPPDRLLVETDAPFLAPVPHRGRPNEPALVPLVGEAVAAVRGVPVEEVARWSWDNALRVFALSE
jgi:TatD DNase family protein